jgi:hypothetical protein
MAQIRFTCSLTRADEPACQSCARVTIVDLEGATARGCPRHAVAALDGTTLAHVDWADSKGLNRWEREAIELSEKRSKLGEGISCGEASGFSAGEDHQQDSSSVCPVQMGTAPRPWQGEGRLPGGPPRSASSRVSDIAHAGLPAARHVG